LKIVLNYLPLSCRAAGEPFQQRLVHPLVINSAFLGIPYGHSVVDSSFLILYFEDGVCEHEVLGDWLVVRVRVVVGCKYNPEVVVLARIVLDLEGTAFSGAGVVLGGIALEAGFAEGPVKPAIVA